MHICNTFFEWELSEKRFASLQQALEVHPIFLQLQFLPLFYASNNETLLVSALPDADYIKYIFDTLQKRLSILPLDNAETGVLNSWAASDIIQKWADRHKIDYSAPSLEIAKSVHSKEFAHALCPIPGAQLLFNQEQLKEWMSKRRGKLVFKSLLAASGGGHFLFEAGEDEAKLMQFLHLQWSSGKAVLAQPWLKRRFDFSTQWLISASGEINELGSCICINDDKGKYVATEVPTSEGVLGAIDQQRAIAEKVLQKMRAKGYFGNVGFDGMVYENEKGEVIVHPLVEVNARKTMGFVALMLQRLHFPDKILRLSYTNRAEVGVPLLPMEIRKSNGKMERFSRQCFLNVQ